MASLLYFLPNQSPAAGKLDKLRELGLGYAFEAHAGVAQTLSGPSMHPGVILADKALPENLRGFYPGSQAWLKIPQHPHEAWVGYTSGQLPTPAELARKQQLTGHWVTLADERDWLVPCARRLVNPDAQQMDFFCSLPTQLGVDAQGKWLPDQPLARYAPLWQRAVQWWNATMAAEITEQGAAYPIEDILDAAVETMQANYRLGKMECVLLGLLTIEHAHEILNALVDLPTITAWLKKKALAGESEN